MLLGGQEKKLMKNKKKWKKNKKSFLPPSPAAGNEPIFSTNAFLKIV